jgi:hypothetical protein
MQQIKNNDAALNEVLQRDFFFLHPYERMLLRYLYMFEAHRSIESFLLQFVWHAKLSSKCYTYFCKLHKETRELQLRLKHHVMSVIDMKNAYDEAISMGVLFGVPTRPHNADEAQKLLLHVLDIRQAQMEKFHAFAQCVHRAQARWNNPSISFPFDKWHTNTYSSIHSLASLMDTGS